MNNWTRIFAFVALLLLQVFSSGATPNPRFAEAERLYHEGSYKQAHDAYRNLADDLGNLEDQRWVEFRLAETLARSEASTENADDSSARSAESNLRKFVEPNRLIDRVWAEAHEALGDLGWFGSRGYNWHRGWPNYEKALDFWAGSTNLTYAADRYWSIIHKAAQPPRVQPHYYYGQFDNHLPQGVLENALKIARNEDERARANFMIAMTLRNGGSWEQRFRAPHHFEQSLKLKKDTHWYDDALYYYGHWMAHQGAGVQDENGNWTFHPDYTKALELFRRLTAEFREGETQWFDDAQRMIRDITQPSLQLSVAHVFLPESEIEFHLNWRNIDAVELTIYKIDLLKEIGLASKTIQSHGWIEGFDPTSAEKVKTWKSKPKNQRPHSLGSEAIRLEEKLPVGAYIIAGRAGAVESRELILVSDLSIVTQATATQLLVFVCDATSGAPARNAAVRLWERRSDEIALPWSSQDKTADANGVILFELDPRRQHRELLVTAKAGDRQAFSLGHSGYNQQEPDGQWRIYASTDRPAYRPGEKVQWKIVARLQRANSYSVPSGQTITLRIADPRGAEIRKEKLKLNEFGSAWGEVELSAEMPLGQYNVTFQNEREDQHFGDAALFRLEEYKLPDFKVAVQTPEENGRRKTFLLGEKVEVEIRADYYFGGPVANATVEAVVYQNPYYQNWPKPREFSWLYEDESHLRRPQRGNGQVVKRETLKTDAQGKARLVIESSLNQSGDLEYRIEARVVDASRREIIGSDRVRVTRHRFFVHAKPTHKIHRPQDKVEVEFRAQDANEHPVAAAGKVQVTRDYWYEIWLAPDGREVKGDELKRLRSAAVFPPRIPTGEPGWRLKFRGYQHDEILTRTVKTGTNGLATIDFTAPREGFYRITWLSDEAITPGQDKIPSRPVRAETFAWVATGASADLGYRSGALEILVDKQTLRSGEKTPVMLSVPGNDRYVLFTVSGADLIDYQLLHLDGSVKLLQLDLDEKHIPNAFIDALMVGDQQLHTDREELIVPPTKNFLSIDVTPDRSQYRPGEKGAWRIKTLDHSGNPVSAEVALAIVDDSIYYIQEDLAGDPRQFFFGAKRPAMLQTSSSFNYRSYAKLLPRSEVELASDADLAESRAIGLSYYDLTKTKRSRADAKPRYSRSLGRAESLGLGDMSTASPVPAASMDSFGGVAANLGKAFKQERGLSYAGYESLAAGTSELPPEDSPVQVRSDFRSTILWQPALKTAADGTAEVSITYPDSLTTWRATARAVTPANQFGHAQDTTRTKMPLIVRLQAPRFFLVGDTVTISAVINNNTDAELTVTPSLEAASLDLPKMERASLKIAANSEARADFTIHPRKPGELKLKVTARSSQHADSMERAYTVHEHGIDKFIATSGKSRGAEALALLRLPAERKPSTTAFHISVTPSLAVTMLDALPYLVNYPYGCVEQTMSRFLPATITAKTLNDLGLKPEDVLNRVFGGIASERVRERTATNHSPNLAALSDITSKGLQRLYDFQHPDGGWGWWKEGDSDSFMTAYVLWGLILAREANVEVKADVITRAAAWLDTQLVQAESQPDLQAWLLHALAVKNAAENARAATEFQTTAFNHLWNNRAKLNAYTRALFALSAHHLGKSDEARTLISNLENGVVLDQSPARSQLLPGRSAGSNNSAQSTAHWGEDGIHYRWSEGGVEATAFALRALLAIDPQNKLVEPVANWLIKNRRGAQWSNTRDTAIVLLALNDYLRATREIHADLDYELFVNGASLGRKKLSGADVFNAPHRFAVPSNLIRDGDNNIRIVRHSGSSPIYFAAEASYFSLEEPITAAGNEIFVKRQYYRLRAVPTLLKGFAYEKVELRSGDEIPSGERLETVLTIEAKNNYEYLVFEDLKPAGIEAVELRSGQNLSARRIRAAGLMAANTSGDIHTAQLEADRYTGDTRYVYQELRDRKVALFLDKLPQGFWEIRYETRAETPGEFHALPVVAHAMYVPEIRANSTEQIVQVIDKN